MAFLSQLKPEDFAKKPGDLIKSAEWNALGNEVIELGKAKVDRDGDTIQGPLSVTGKTTLSSTLAVAGNVGIGTTDPAVKLTISGPSSTDQTEATGMLRLIRPTGSGGVRSVDLRVGRAGNGGEARLEFALSAKGGDVPDVTVMTLLGTGNVGIGTNNPQAKLTVAVSSTDASTLPLKIEKGTTSYLTILNAGNVGIGTTDPQVKLTVSGLGASTSIETSEVLRLMRPRTPNVKEANSVDFRVGTFESFVGGKTRLDIALSGAPGDGNGWGTKPEVTVMTLLANGNVGIGTATPSAKLDVNGTVTATSFSGSGAGLTGLTASNITGTLTVAQIPNLDASKITTGTLDTARIPNLSATKITSDTLTVDRIPNLSANKITSDTLHADRIPSLPASKITSGVLAVAQIPDLSADKIKTAGTMVNTLTIVTSGNVGIGTTSPTAKLDVNGLVKVSGAITPSTGNTSSTGIMFPTDPFGGTGDAAWIRYHNARGGEKATLEIGVSNDADDHIILNPSGNVGIGMTDPQAKLEVNGTVKATSFSGSGANLTGLTATQIPNLDASKITSGTLHVDRIPSLPASKITSGTLAVAQIPDLAASKITSGGTMAGVLTVQTNGNVGIGTNNPQAKLDVKGNIAAMGLSVIGEFEAAAKGVEFRHNNGTQGIGFGYNTIYAAGTATNHNLNLLPKDAGGVGIGTTNPQAKLDVNGTLKVTGATTLSSTFTVAGTITFNDTVSFGTASRQMLNLYGQSYGIGVQGFTQYFRTQSNFAWFRGGQHNDAALNPGNGTVQMVITDSDRVGIGTTAPSQKLHVAGDALANNWNRPSDARIKTNLAPIEPLHSLQRLLALTLYEYGYLPEFQPGPAGQKYHGFLAQEVEQVIPEAVSITGDHKLGEGRVIEGLRAVAHDRIFSEAVGAIQALYGMVQSQAARLRVLEEQVAGGQPA